MKRAIRSLVLGQESFALGLRNDSSLAQVELASKPTKMHENAISTPELLWCSQVLDTIGAATLTVAASPGSKGLKYLTPFSHLIDHILWITWNKGGISLGASIVPP